MSTQYSGASGLTALGVRRPILISVINLLIILAGLAAAMGIDIRELPDVELPIVTTRINYPGASPETIDTEIASVVEGAIARVSGVERIQTESEDSNMRVTAEFAPGYDLDTAANDIREALARIQRQLPDELKEISVQKADDQAQAIMQLSAFSNTLSKEELSRRIEKDIAPAFFTIEGVADVTLTGSQPRVLRILMNPSRMAERHVTASDVIATMRSAPFDIPTGNYDSGNQEMIVRAYASVTEPESVEQLHISGDTRIGDVADVYYGPRKAVSYTLLDGRMVIGLGIVRQPGSNTIAIADEVRKRVDDINERSDDLQLSVTSDDSIYINGALREVLLTLIFAILIVLAVIGIFLGQWRAVLVPAVTMPVALIGTLGAMWVFHFSINLLTLLALVLATGLIVDDAIVVLENIQRRHSQGLGKMAAAVLGTQQVFFAVLATTITLIAVFVPIAFLGGDTGPLFREFSLVLAISVAISMFVAVSLCPMLASRLPDDAGENGFFKTLHSPLQKIGHAVSQSYYRSLQRVMSHPVISLLAALLIAVAGFYGFTLINSELVPAEDRGVLSIIMTGPDGTTLQYIDGQAQKVETILRPYQESGVITDIYSIIGWKDPNRAQVVAPLRNWEDRDISQMDLAREISRKTSALVGARAVIVQGNSLQVGDTGTSGGEMQVALLGYDYADLAEAADEFARQLQARIPEISDIRIEYDTSQPQLYFTINREKAWDLGVPMERIAETLQSMVDEYELIELNVEDETIPIMLGSAGGAINSPSDLLNIYVASRSGKLIPLSALIKINESGVAGQLDRYARHRAIAINVGLPPGTALGNTLEQITNIADEVLPANITLLPLGEAATFSESSHAVAITFFIALAVVFLILAAQFESVGSAVIVIFTVPFGLAAAVFALLYTGQTLNLYTQIGFVMLIGLMTKNSILLVEFMDQLRDSGMSVRDAIEEGVKVRLRPVAMTVLATVLGSLPLILSQGPGMEARRAIGWVIFGGLGLSSLFTLYLTPLGYALIAPHIKPRSHASDKLDAQLSRAAQAELSRPA